MSELDPTLGLMNKQWPNPARAIFSAMGRTTADYRYAYLILIVHTATMGGLTWYLGVDPHYTTGTAYLRWSLVTIANLAFFYMLWLVLRMLLQGNEHPTRALKERMGQVLLANDRLAHAIHSTCIFVALIVVFANVKSTIPAISPFSWDETLIHLDRALFAGLDPYKVTGLVFGNIYGIVGLNFVYNLWLVIFVASMLWAPWTGNHTLRLRYILTALLTWFVGGNILAICFSSAGPCFVGLVTGDNTFEPLMKLLKEVDTETGMVWALIAQDMLWDAYSLNDGDISGISAMPSMHVAVSVVVACLAWEIGGIWRWLGAAFSGCIFIGSVQLGWHYASDGIVGGILALLFWKASGYLAPWSLDHSSPVPEPA
ncbi:phosphatase PAP2 family protein [Sinorhizobium alkalisoli]|nr:phosphatase PAP2 family protein [Sinorhizobium alkalisoli]